MRFSWQGMEPNGCGSCPAMSQTCHDLVVGQHQWYHFKVGAQPMLVYFSGDWDVHWGYGLLVCGHLLCCIILLPPPAYGTLRAWVGPRLLAHSLQPSFVLPPTPLPSVLRPLAANWKVIGFIGFLETSQAMQGTAPLGTAGLKPLCVGSYSGNRIIPDFSVAFCSPALKK